MHNTTPNPLLLDRNENLYGPAPKCFEVLRNITLNELSIYSRDFTRGVKSRLSERLSEELGIPEPQLLLSEGSEDMLKQAVHCYLGPGEKILCPDQSWWYYRAVAAEMGGETITYRLKEAEKNFFYDVDEMIGLYQEASPRVVLIASPNNPTGNSFQDEDLHRLTEAFRESIVILDEAYWGFAEETNEHIAGLIGKYRNLLVLRTFSKFYALAGARIGFAAAGASLSRLTKFSSRYLGYNRISEELALAALDSKDYYREVNQNMQRDRQRWYEFFDGLKEWNCYRSDANFILVRYPSAVKEALQRFLAKSGVTIKFFSETGFTDCIRITLGTSGQNQRVLSLLTMFVHNPEHSPG
jgi:histidinol-phosphate aminotransferase